MEAQREYDQAIELYAAYLQAAEIAREGARAAREALALVDPGNPALKISMKEYAMLKPQPVLFLAEILFGGGRQEVRQPVSPQLAFLLGSVALARGYSVERVLAVLKGLIERERRGLSFSNQRDA